jgi:hypothetical protein
LTGCVVNAEAACVSTKKAITPAMTRSVLLIGPPSKRPDYTPRRDSVIPLPLGTPASHRAFGDEWLRSRLRRNTRSVFVLSRRKKNRSTISRSRSFASWAERRLVLGHGGNVSNTAPRIVVWRAGACPIVLGAGRSGHSGTVDRRPGLKGA